MYQKVDSNLDSQEREQEVIAFWKQNQIFEKSMEQRAGCPEFSFYDGPPTANGKPHIGHILTRVMKDIVPRYKTMKGHLVRRKAGWDTHGLPVELEVEKTLGINGKPQIEQYGVQKFIQKCKDSVFVYKDLWQKMSERVGYWVDMDHPYVTYEDNYIESVWWSLSEIHKKGLLYKGHKVVPYCCRCGTSLSSHEVAQGYKDVEDRTVVVAFDLVGSEESVLAWTTTPWTLPSNVALAVGKKHEYSLVVSEGKKYWVASALVTRHFEEGKYTIAKTVKGDFLAGKQYEPLYPSYAPKKSKDTVQHIVVCADFVTLDDGTGVVHIAPAYGDDDAQVGKQYGLSFVQAVGDRGEFDNGQFAGLKFKESDKHIIKDLKTRGKLYREIRHTHSYPHCWRCDTPLMYFARPTWFIAMSQLREKLVANNKTIHWLPGSVGSGRMENFLDNVIDWGLSRERYWGTPLPLWVCDKCGDIHAVGSKAELKQLGKLNADIELHKPYVDKVEWACKCGGTMKRTPEVIDCWYDSGAMPFAQYHYPFENKEIFDKTYPADFISEAIDQTRGWFYTLSAISTLLFDKAAFKNCIVLGHVCDKNGQKMSKHKGNVVDPWSVLDAHGADAVRWYFCVGSAPWLPSRFHMDAVVEVKRKFLGTLQNVYSFFVLYAEIDKFDPSKHKMSSNLCLMDKWVLSKLNTLIDTVSHNLDEYKIFESARELAVFVDELSNWYVRRSRERFWAKGMGKDKVDAYLTLHTVLKVLSQLIAPFVPFLAESMWQNIVRSVDKKEKISVHLSDYPLVNKKQIFASVEEQMQIVLTIVENGRSARSAANIKNRQPLSKAYISGKNKEDINAEMVGIIREELNVESIEFTKDDSKFVTYECKPQLKTLGAKYGSKLGIVREFLNQKATHIVDYFKTKANQLTVYKDKVDDLEIELLESDVLVSIKSVEGYVSASDRGIVVSLDTRLDDALIEKGLVREITSKIQSLRKDSNFDVMDKIKIAYHTTPKLQAVLQKNKKQISGDTLCAKMAEGKVTGGVVLDINGERLEIKIEK
ncbi:MAG: isoleucine--tRNA ligase, partial [Firmicutes bacterium]|nr:isoleucine--tRNA ligase [Bacillota bacterium]